MCFAAVENYVRETLFGGIKSVTSVQGNFAQITFKINFGQLCS